MEDRIYKKLAKSFPKAQVEVKNESHKHQTHKDHSHFFVTVISKIFEDIPLKQRHQMVYSCLKEEFQEGIHALSVRAFTLKEWSSKEKFKSPSCRKSKKT